MKQLLSVSLVVLTLAAYAVPNAAAQSPGLQKGVSVRLAASTNAAPMPEADNENAFIVTVTDEGTVYLGVNRIMLPDLKEKVRSTPLQRGQKLYIKADARAPYAKVLEVLDATRTGGVAPQVLLTAHTGPSAPGTIVRPEGVEVRLGPPL
ncbi:MAG TPA: biopolymer transporter ExbD [Candidatus Sulfotelmatobacter sp.]|jgi:biopolymer transport protein ExbD